MALAHTILAVLSHCPCSGYDIGKRFDEGVGCYWKASQQQIYRELSKMETQGWVNFEKIPQEGKPDKKVYQITELGHQELAKWFAEPTEPTPVREDLLVKVMAAAHMPRDLLLKELHHRRQLHQTQLQRYQDKEVHFQARQNNTAAEQFRYLTLRRGIRYEEDWIGWCDEVLDFLKTHVD
ncbi:MAG: PadR family transcriptional regulator [Cyanobacteria bacterium P01_A01_bin.123]